MSNEWYWERDGEQIGPVTLAELKALAASGELAPARLVWKEGMTDWTEASQVPGLFDAAKPVAAAQFMPVAAVASAPRALVPTAEAFVPVEVQTAFAAPQLDSAQVLAALPADDGPVVRIARSFSFARVSYRGPVLLSAQAIYLIKAARMSSAHHGAAGYMISAALSRREDMRTCAAAQLPAAVTQPLKPRMLRKADAIVLPRTAVSLVKSGARFKVTCGSDKFAIRTGLFKRKKTREAFASRGWMLDTELTPTTAPIHGDGLGRAPDDAARKPMSMPARVALFVGGVLLIAAVIYLKAKSDMN